MKKIILLILVILLVYLIFDNNPMEGILSVREGMTNNISSNMTEELTSNISEVNEHDCDKVATCSVDRCGVDNLLPILDPRFNMREAAKQCLLLEDHLNNQGKRCFDCIRKHFLTIDGFLEEAISLEGDNNMRGVYRQRHNEWMKIQKIYAQNPTSNDNIDNVAKMIRVFRKPLVEKYFDTVSEYSINDSESL